MTSEQELHSEGRAALAARWFRSATEQPDVAERVKLVHTSDLANLGRLPRYQDHDGISLAEFKRQRKALRQTQTLCANLIHARADIVSLDNDQLVHASAVEVELPRSIFRGQVSTPLPPFGWETAMPKCDQGACMAGKLRAQGQWSKRWVTVEVQCASWEYHAQRIAEAKHQLTDASSEQKNALDAFDESPFRAPVLFISHRWRSITHPDPKGETLKRLLQLGDAYLILDYCSFPQAPFDEAHAGHLEFILSKMSSLMENVVVLSSADYLSRGWCVYEYLLASLEGTLVCDEIQDERFMDLLRWSRTPAPAPASLFRDGIAGPYANFIQESILHSINRLLPQFKTSSYTLDSDKIRVQKMLRDQLLKSLPTRRLHDPYLGETLSKPWTEKELESAFDTELSWDSMVTIPTQAFDVSLASSIEEGVKRGFQLTTMPSSDWKTTNALNPQIGKRFENFAQHTSRHDLGKI